MNDKSTCRQQLAETLRSALGERSIVLVGMMGAGKTTIGRRIAARLDIPFTDADAEIEAAAGQSISDIFAEHGEEVFRAGERRVIARLLANGPQVLATGGGAFTEAETRGKIADRGISVWLRADFDTLYQRVRRRSHRPLLQADNPEKVLRELMDKRYPVYAEADLTITTRNVPHEVVVGEIIEALADRLDVAASEQHGTP